MNSIDTFKRQGIFTLFSAFMLLTVMACNNQSNNTVQEKAPESTLPLKVGNPTIRDKYTADPAALVYNDTVYLYAGHDECPARQHYYLMNEWLIYSSTDMVTWTEKATLPVSAFNWAKGDAWAAHVIEKNGKFYWYVTVSHATIGGKSIGVAVADHPLGPWKDALGKALITNDMTKAPFQIDVGGGKMHDMTWDDIDPAIFTDDDGQSYIFWGNTSCHYAKLKDNMIELDGPIMDIKLPNYTEAPWVHKKGDWYYLSYAYEFPEKTAYAMSKSIDGPWEFKGILNELAGNSNTNHQAVIEFKNKDYFIYHNGSLPTDGASFRRSVCIDYLYYNPDGTMKKVIMTTEGVDAVK
ncbi:glycoside hydrolase family 43 protein [Plebeiibacterium marinum]|uniref:Glycoside hydrolase family 43 protein n=1 Tax=Plebeiibacterium marinum TaxID=2992111 RepID=A0AAE3SLW6_9BACT|nr:glycoside hydrolase family 43 protein [Plebeiobacterium marinum]MCW3806935.1 glycoside hydrolase family 43 protein [Plebeiobacterium marinum]